MFKMYRYDNYGKSFLGLCSTKEVGAQNIKDKASRLVFVEDCEPYDYFTVHVWVDGIDVIRFSARTVEKCEEFIRPYGSGLWIVGQKFGQEFVNLWD